jgi:hypothetical protein
VHHLGKIMAEQDNVGNIFERVDVKISHIMNSLQEGVDDV